jgi:hypothetical protein
MAWDLSKLTRNNNPHLKKVWGIYTPQKRKLAVGPRAAPVRPVEDHVWFEDWWKVAYLCDE